MQEEIWKDVPGYEDMYEASTYGRVRSLDRVVLKKGNKGSMYYYTIKGRILKQKLTKQGYFEVAFSNGKRNDLTSLRVNRLVAFTFLLNPDNLPEVHHIDHEKTNNRIENLKWVTKSENIKEAIRAGKHHGGFKKGIKHHNAIYTDEQVLKIFELNNLGYKRSVIADMIGCTRPYVSTTLNNPTRSRIKNLNYVKTI
jgi:hypothetical protein